MAASGFTGEAIVCRAKLSEQGWGLETVSPRAHAAHELVIEMVASGVCHTDVGIGDMDPGPLSYYPRVLGHEGEAAAQPAVRARRGADAPQERATCAPWARR